MIADLGQRLPWLQFVTPDSCAHSCAPTTSAIDQVTSSRTLGPLRRLSRRTILIDSDGKGQPLWYHPFLGNLKVGSHRMPNLNGLLTLGPWQWLLTLV